MFGIAGDRRTRLWFSFARVSDSHSVMNTKLCCHRKTARRAVSVKILSTVETSCTTNPQQLAVIKLEGYSWPTCSKQPRLVDCRIGVGNKLDRRRRRRVLLTTRSTCRDRVWDKVPAGSALIFTARCYASAVGLLAMGLCPSVSVCLCPCLSQAGVLLKWQNVGSHKQHHTIPQGD